MKVRAKRPSEKRLFLWDFVDFHGKTGLNVGKWLRRAAGRAHGSPKGDPNRVLSGFQALGILKPSAEPAAGVLFRTGGSCPLCLWSTVA
jgi:hypothetical protein